MDYLDKDAAKKTLLQIIGEKDEGKLQLEHVENWDTIMSRFQFEQTDAPRKWRLLNKSTGNLTSEPTAETATATEETTANEDSEAVFTISGFIVKKNLPPFKFVTNPSQKRGMKNIKYRTQSVCITGFGCDLFDRGIAKLQAMEDIFKREVGQESVECMKITTYEGHPCIEFTNWVFTSLSFAPGAKHIPFSEFEDPSGAMERARGEDIVRTFDNVVHYYWFKRIESKDANVNTGHVITAKPTTYQLGDLVEVGFTIAGTPLRGDRVAFKPLLNYLMLRDSTDLEIATEKQREEERKNIPEKTIKRQIGFSVQTSSKKSRVD